MSKRILIICTGNSCRSQIAEGFLQSFDQNLEVYSAGTNPATQISLRAIKVMKEIGIDISGGRPKSVDQFTAEPFDYVITVCDYAKETCPIFTGKVKHRLHIGFEDPGFVIGTEKEKIAAHRCVRDEIKEKFSEFYVTSLKPNSQESS